MKHQNETGALRRVPWPRKAIATVCAVAMALLSVPLGVFHAPEIALAASGPTLAEKATWYKGSTDKYAITTINIVDSYTPSGTPAESWDASAAGDGSVMAYVEGATLTIAGNGSGKIKGNGISTGAFADFSSATAINGVGMLDMSSVAQVSNLFSGCKSVQSLDVGAWDTGSFYDMSGMFNDCEALTALDVSNWDTANSTSLWRIFRGCSSLTSLDVSGWNTSKVKAMGYTFYGMPVTSLNVSNWDLSSCKGIAYMFARCANLKTIDLSNWDTSSVEEFDHLFYKSGIESINLSTFDLSSCTRINSMFLYCDSLKSVNVSGWSFPTTVQHGLQFMFAGCTALESIDLSSWDVSQVTDLESVFQDCESLTDVNVSNWNTSKATDFRTCFSHCYSLEKLDLSSWDTSAVSGDTENDLLQMFQGCHSLRQITLGSKFSFAGGSTSRLCDLPTPDPTYIPGATGKWQAVDSGTVAKPKGSVYAASEVPNNVAETYVAEMQKVPTLAAHTSWYKGSTERSAITTIKIVDSYTVSGSETESWDASAEQDGSVMAYIDADGTTLTIAGNGYGCIYANENSSDAFAYFGSLTTFSGAEVLNTSNTTSMSYIFCGDSKLTSLNLDSWDVSKVTQMCNAFQNCESLASVGPKGLKSWQTGKVTQLSSLFDGCKSLTHLDIGSWDTSSCESFGYTFCNCVSLTSIDVSGWNTSKTRSLMRTFQGCSSVERLDLSGWSSTQELTTMSEMVANCTSLKVLDLGNLDTSNAKWIESLFDNCRSLQQVTLGPKFTFTGNGYTSCVLPTPDPAYIPGAIGKWQAVGSGTVSVPAGTIYDPADVPSNKAETYVMPMVTADIDVPIKVIMAVDAQGNFVTPTAKANKIVNHTAVGAKVVSAVATAKGTFQLKKASTLASTDTDNVFGGTIKAGTGSASDLTGISTAGSSWSMAKGSVTDGSNQIPLQLTGAVRNVKGNYLTAPTSVFGITYTFELDI